MSMTYEALLKKLEQTHKQSFPTHVHTNVSRVAKTNIHQLCVDTGCQLEDLPRVMDDRERYRERAKWIHATSMTWWWLQW